ncbi:MAG: class I SAM-dependent methyltransferase [Candidatus Krumholzibacteria bacterium]|nr:class I SAM-dependent methyltransferase [Candidatus Krumholzibacteria bacterium]MDH4338201.1 class I SAM-dependent methyltransferase [Candidatus Krumholzibacteria bacterium]MDH5270876.1 class I SAM-dependent methyltransferase [Candidatus Krumholzibacteria bacterium]
MDERLQRRVQRYGWDRAVSSYEKGWGKQLEPAQTLLLTMAMPRAGERVLDIACGTGLVTFRAADMVGPSGLVVGTDISDAMVEKCTRAAEARGLGNATFSRMEAEKLDVKDDFFDAVLCGLGMMYVTDFAGSIKEMYRVTKPGGRAASAVWGRRGSCGWADIFEIVERRVSTDVCPLFFQLGTGDTQKRLFEGAGFKDVKNERINVTLDYENARDACIAAFAGGPVAMAYSRFDEKTRERAYEEYTESIAPFKQGGVYKIPGEFVVTLGTRKP